MFNNLFHRLTDTSDGGKHLPWITRRVMAWLSGFDADKYWRRQFIVANPKARVNPLLKAYYLLWIKRVDSKHNCSFGTSFNKGMRAITPPRPSENGGLGRILVDRAAIVTPPKPI